MEENIARSKIPFLSLIALEMNSFLKSSRQLGVPCGLGSVGGDVGAVVCALLKEAREGLPHGPLSLLGCLFWFSGCHFRFSQHVTSDSLVLEMAELMTF